MWMCILFTDMCIDYTDFFFQNFKAFKGNPHLTELNISVFMSHMRELGSNKHVYKEVLQFSGFLLF